MKKILISLCFASALGLCKGQLIDAKGQASVGWARSSPSVSLAACFNSYGFGISPEIFIIDGLSEGANFGAKFSYEHYFGTIGIQAGYGKYYDLYSTDEYDKYKNGFKDLYFISLHKTIESEILPHDWFLEYDLYDGNCISIGIRETLK